MTGVAPSLQNHIPEGKQGKLNLLMLSTTGHCRAAKSGWGVPDRIVGAGKWEVAPSLNLLPNTHRAGLVLRTASVPLRRLFLLLIYAFLSYILIFYQFNLFPNLKSLFCGSRAGKKCRLVHNIGARLGI